MKRLLFIILLFGVCLHVNQAHAQRCLPGMRGIQLTGGLSDNMRWKNGVGISPDIFRVRKRPDPVRLLRDTLPAPP